MKKLLKISIFLSLISAVISCSSSNDTPSPSPVAENYVFSINQSLTSIQELDNVTFSVSSVNNASVNNVTWSINNVLIDPPNTELTKSFTAPGTYIVKASIDYYKSDNSLANSIVEKTITVTARPKDLVTIKQIEILSYTGSNQFYVSGLGYYVKMKFDIKELDEFGTNQIKYISSENSQNWSNGQMTYPISWNTSAANYKVIVYQTGNFYPNNQNYYQTEISFYGAGSVALVQQPYNVINNLKLDLNPYRSLQPTVVNINNAGMQIKLTLQWN